VIEIRVKTNP